jgi:hypothetical protein
MGTDSVQAIFISPGGGVGFANSNPVYRVDVNGDVRCTGSFIGGTPGGIWDFGARAQLNGRVFINYDSGDPTVTGPVALNLHGAFGGGLQFVDSFGERTVRLWTAVVPADAAPIFTTFNIGIGTSLTGGLDPEPLIIWSREIATGIRGTALPLLRNSNPGPGTRQIWYDPNDGNVVKYQP